MSRPPLGGFMKPRAMPEEPHIRRPSPQRRGEGSMVYRRLAVTVLHSDGAVAMARRQGRAKQLEKPSSPHAETRGEG